MGGGTGIVTTIPEVDGFTVWGCLCDESEHINKLETVKKCERAKKPRAKIYNNNTVHNCSHWLACAHTKTCHTASGIEMGVVCTTHSNAYLTEMVGSLGNAHSK